MSERSIYMAFHTPYGDSWKVRRTEHDINSEQGLLKIIEEIEEYVGVSIVPIFFKELTI